MDRLNLDEQLELLRDDEPAVAKARTKAAADPNIAARAERLRAFDAAVGASLRQVPVPEGLAGRIMTRIGVESAARAVRRRRNFILAGAGSVVAIALVCAVSLWRWPDPRFTTNNVAAAAEKLYHQRHLWKDSIDEMPALPEVGLRGGIVAGYQSSVAFLNKSAIGYRLQGPGGEPGVLIVVDKDYFPPVFDFSATYVIQGNEQLDIRFLVTQDKSLVCILIAPDLQPFQAKKLIL